jgi:hypothetical protein
VSPEASSPLSCPTRSEFIQTRDEALLCYKDRLVGQKHIIVVARETLQVVFHPDEIHAFTDDRAPCPLCDVVRRGGPRPEERCFCRTRARMLDRILEVVELPGASAAARVQGGVTLFGPGKPGPRKLAVVLAPGRDVWFVRTSHPIDKKDPVGP